MRLCSIASCGKKHWCRGYCLGHYNRWKSAGNPELPSRRRGRPRSTERCLVPGCTNPWPYYKALCRHHYERKRKWGDPLGADPRRIPKPCGVAGCSGLCVSRGFCVMHYVRFRKDGTPGEVAMRRAPSGAGSIDSNGYRRVSVSGRHKKEHRVVVERLLGRSLQSFEHVHHKNGVRHDNREENLELWTHYQPGGQRPVDLIRFVLRYYRADVLAALAVERNP